MKPSDKLLKLAEEFEDAVSSWTVEEEHSYIHKIQENQVFADKARHAAITTVSALTPHGVDFDIKIVDQGPDVDSRCFVTLAIELMASDKFSISELAGLAKKVYISLAAEFDNVKFVELLKREDAVILTVDIEK